MWALVAVLDSWRRLLGPKRGRCCGVCIHGTYRPCVSAWCSRQRRHTTSLWRAAQAWSTSTAAVAASSAVLAATSSTRQSTGAS